MYSNYDNGSFGMEENIPKEEYLSCNKIYHYDYIFIGIFIVVFMSYILI